MPQQTQKSKTIITAKTDNYPIVINDLGSVNDRLMTMNASTSKTFTLPSVESTEIGKAITLIKIGSGDVVIATSDSDTILDGTTSSSVSSMTLTELYKAVTLVLNNTTTWVIQSVSGPYATLTQLGDIDTILDEIIG